MTEVRYSAGPPFKEIEDVDLIAEMIEAARRAGLLEPPDE